MSASRYVAAVVEGVLADVRGAGEGTRSDALRRGAVRLGQFVGAGELARADVEAMLFDAAAACGFIASRKDGDGAGAARSTIRKGIDKGSKNPWKGGTDGNGGRYVPHHSFETSPPVQAAPIELPCDKWLDRAQAFFDELNNLPISERELARERVQERGLDPHRAYTEYGIRWNWKADISDKYTAGTWHPRAAWGIEPDKDPTTGATSIRVPRGLVIASMMLGMPIAIEIRCEDTRRGKFNQIPGGSDPAAYCIGDDGKPVIVTEGALDAALLYQETDGAFQCMASLGKGKPLPRHHLALCQQAPVVWYVKDGDAGGDDGAKLMLSQIPGAKVVTVPAGKDPTGLAKLHYTGQGDGLPTVRQWLKQCGIMAPESVNPLPPIQPSDIPTDTRQQADSCPEWPGDKIGGLAVCSYPAYVRSMMVAHGLAAYASDLRGYGIPSHGLPTILQGYGFHGWRVEMSQNGTLELVPGADNPTHGVGCRNHLRAHADIVRRAIESWEQYKAYVDSH